MQQNDQTKATDIPAETLSGGNMNAPVKKGDRVYRQVTDGTPTIHRILQHVRGKGLS